MSVPPKPVVPYITAWSVEAKERACVVERAAGIAYSDEGLHDRDSHGTLWRRVPSRQGQGKPVFGKVHPLRQRRVMRRLLCQVCAGPADRNEQGVLWLLGDDRDDWPGWPESMAATHPPVCLPCARASVRLCPYLRRKMVAVRVRSPEVGGVYGLVYQRGWPFPRAVEEAVVPYDDPMARWVVAGQLVMGLHDCTFVDLEAEVVDAEVVGQERHGRPVPFGAGGR